MKYEFNNFSDQMCYVNKYIKRNTNLEKNCQLCGNKGFIRHNYRNPHEIQIICKDCRQYIKSIGSDNMIVGVPTIDIREYVTNPKCDDHAKNKLTEDNINKIKELLDRDLTKRETLAYLDLSENKFNKLINQYEQQVDSNIKEKLNQVFHRGVCSSIKRFKLTSGEDSPNNVNKIKKELMLSASDILRLSNGRLLSKSTVSNIATGKAKANLETKLILVDVFNRPLKEIFPEHEHDLDITSSSQYYKYVDKVNNTIKTYYNKKKNSDKRCSIEKIASILEMKSYKIYNIIEKGKAFFEPSDLTKVLKNIHKLK